METPLGVELEHGVLERESGCLDHGLDREEHAEPGAALVVDLAAPGCVHHPDRVQVAGRIDDAAQPGLAVEGARREADAPADPRIGPEQGEEVALLRGELVRPDDVSHSVGGDGDRGAAGPFGRNRNRHRHGLAERREVGEAHELDLRPLGSHVLEGQVDRAAPIAGDRRAEAAPRQIEKRTFRGPAAGDARSIEEVGAPLARVGPHHRQVPAGKQRQAGVQRRGGRVAHLEGLVPGPVAAPEQDLGTARSRLAAHHVGAALRVDGRDGGGAVGPGHHRSEARSAPVLRREPAWRPHAEREAHVTARAGDPLHRQVRDVTPEGAKARASVVVDAREAEGAGEGVVRVAAVPPHDQVAVGVRLEHPEPRAQSGVDRVVREPGIDHRLVQVVDQETLGRHALVERLLLPVLDQEVLRVGLSLEPQLDHRPVAPHRREGERGVVRRTQRAVPFQVLERPGPQV